MVRSEPIRSLLVFADSQRSRTADLVRDGLTLAIRRSVTAKDTKVTNGEKERGRASLVPAEHLMVSR